MTDMLLLQKRGKLHGRTISDPGILDTESPELPPGMHVRY